MWLVRSLMRGIVAFWAAGLRLIGGAGKPYRAAVVNGGASNSMQTEARHSDIAQSRGCRWLRSGMDRGDLLLGNSGSTGKVASFSGPERNPRPGIAEMQRALGAANNFALWFWPSPFY